MKVQNPISSLVPGMDPIELVSYYEEFVWYYPNCELETKAWFVNNIKKDWVILDCGANVGYYSILFAKLASEGHVYSFEPTSTAEMLNANLQHHGIKNVSIIRSALGKSSGNLVENIYRIWGNDPDRENYSFTTVDDFVQSRGLNKVDCIKIDVDSFDFEVLLGSKDTLLNHNPYVMVELNHALSRRNQTNVEALQWLAELGFNQTRVFDNENFLLKRGDDFKTSDSYEMSIIFSKN